MGCAMTSTGDTLGSLLPHRVALRSAVTDQTCATNPSRRVVTTFAAQT